jgi:hypothetical protein
MIRVSGALNSFSGVSKNWRITYAAISTPNMIYDQGFSYLSCEKKSRKIQKNEKLSMATHKSLNVPKAKICNHSKKE